MKWLVGSGGRGVGALVIGRCMYLGGKVVGRDFLGYESTWRPDMFEEKSVSAVVRSSVEMDSMFILDFRICTKLIRLTIHSV